MPVPALTLIGFMDQASGVSYLKHFCAWPAPPPNDVTLIAHWNTARANLGPPFPNAGMPDIQPVPADHDSYLDSVAKKPWVANDLGGLPWSFKLVEIDPLLAFQFHVDIDRAGNLCAGLTDPIPMDDLVKVCLPDTLNDPPQQNIIISSKSPFFGSMMIKSPSLNLRGMEAGIFGTPPDRVAGMYLRTTLPLVQVARFRGKCYLKHGYHRAYHLRMSKATHVPCVFADVPDFFGTGAIDGSTFGEALLTSADPPTVGHFTQGRAFSTQLKRGTRVLHVSWSEYGIPDE